ncbi:DPP IV N-terminal domain-containing protein [Xanthomonas melonis]|uniref:DPP IV N-terminal domain-containing protein n=2 Tax=Xanthomonas melonis TaxID=56456 RepID=A0ABS8NUQ7_9XANT|nr:DPP IV N-terminal domain-containing protein [Xanthomonas melonis]MCD0258525.1 DPP IV N-terminal domain-containing protein [Xanthomonas melonis]MCD0266795.1 DPP IV N-terminal domain-containing protein [Xanthomonas melonis]
MTWSSDRTPKNRLARHLSWRASLMLLTMLAPAALAQPSAPTAAQYAQAMAVSEHYRSLVDREPAEPVWVDTGRFLYRRGVARPGRAPAIEYRLVDAASGRNTLAFDHARLAAALTQAGAQDVDAAALALKQPTLVQQRLGFRLARLGWQCDLARYRCEHRPDRDESAETMDMALPLKQGERMAKTSPDGRWRAWVEQGNLVIAPTGGGERRDLSREGSGGDYYAIDSVEWSPDSQHLAAYRVKAPPPHMVYYIESAPADRVQPRLHQQIYPKPGDALPVMQPVLFDIATGAAHPVAMTLLPNAFTLNGIRWWKGSRGFTFEYNARGHQVYRVIEVDARTAAARTLIEETSPTFIEYSELSGTHEDGGKYARKDLADGAQILWASERDGWEHVYLYDGHRGEVVRQVTRGEWVVRKLDYIDEAAGQLYFTALGMQPGEDPYYRHAYRIGLDGTGLTALTPQTADHQVSYSPDGKWFVDLYSRVDLGPVLELRRSADGGLAHTVERTDLGKLLASGWQPPLPFHSVGRDGKTEIWGVINRPQHFDPHQHYRVIEYIYAGPQGSFVPKTFSAGAFALTGLGFTVAQIDGMGTNNRSRAFHDVAWRNLKDAGLPDRIAWHKAAAAQYPWYDIDGGVGVFGTSAGGQNALGALLFHSEFYVAGVANSGCHDNRMDKIWWNEQWMGWPVGPWYAESSNVENAARLQGHLLLITGDMDMNVDPASTFQVADRLIKANKDFDLLVVPGGDHGAGGDYGRRRLLDFFVRWMQRSPTPEWNRSPDSTAPQPAASTAP